MAAPTSPTSTTAVVALGAVFGALGLAAALLLLEWWVRKRKYGWGGFPWGPQYRAEHARDLVRERGAFGARAGDGARLVKANIADGDLEAQRGRMGHVGSSQVARRKGSGQLWWKTSADERDDESALKRGKDRRARSERPPGGAARDSVRRRAIARRDEEKRSRFCPRRDFETSSLEYDDDMSTVFSSSDETEPEPWRRRSSRPRVPYHSRSQSRATTLVERPQRTYQSEYNRAPTGYDGGRKFAANAENAGPWFNSNVVAAPQRWNPQYPIVNQYGPWPPAYPEEPRYGQMWHSHPGAAPGAALFLPQAQANLQWPGVAPTWQDQRSMPTVPQPVSFPGRQTWDSNRNMQRGFTNPYPSREDYHTGGRVFETEDFPMSSPELESKPAPVAQPRPSPPKELGSPEHKGQTNSKFPAASRGKMETRASARPRPALGKKTFSAASVRGPKAGRKISAPGQAKRQKAMPKASMEVEELVEGSGQSQHYPASLTVKDNAPQPVEGGAGAEIISLINNSLMELPPVQEDGDEEIIIMPDVEVEQRAIAQNARIPPFGGVSLPPALIGMGTARMGPRLSMAMRGGATRRGSGARVARQKMAEQSGRIEELGS
ncbi:hypothetical protein NA57DRAFT_74360 [Rhizodiscina lignyota]|uniref:Uncharacterized protein n=1 Tax=Rhizodiscina lignyota TaxID=1504668 RepID=A0A9P4IJG3_9PEZI|nr:hypothetical protein NA57DRAFT_74360 [Rhizodiscina lignyota]